MLNRFPYNPGHLMVAVGRHVASLADLTPEEREALVSAVILAEQALAAEYRPHAMNLGANLGRVAGAGFPGHLHVHVVPRWNGDTNFMPVIAGTKVLPETLARTWSRLRRAIGKLEAPAAPGAGTARGTRPASRGARRRAGARRG
jgi:ATP adenylyltransferase